MQNMRKFILALALSAAFSISAGAQSSVEYIKEDPLRAAHVLHNYETFGTAVTPAPKGFEPFYISHYGRHGSRYLTSDSDFKKCIPALELCHTEGLLTPEGETLLRGLKNIAAQHEGMYGFLTQKGSRQHREISERMFSNYPRVFKQKDRTEVVAISSPIQRCLQSMANFCTQLKGNSPGLNFHYFTGDRYFDVLAYNTSWTPETQGLPEHVRDSLLFAKLNPERMLKATFTDPSAATDLLGIPAKKFFSAVFGSAAIAQDLDEAGTPDIIGSYFTPEEAAAICDSESARLYGWWCESKDIGNYRAKGTGAPILKDILDKAEAAVQGNCVAADLRFGHDSGLAPLLALLKVQGYDDVVKTSEANGHWQGFREMCMGSNLQLVFFRDKNGEVIVKLLHNERETTIAGLEPYCGPFYKWSNFKLHLMNLIDTK